MTFATNWGNYDAGCWRLHSCIGAVSRMRLLT